MRWLILFVAFVGSIVPGRAAEPQVLNGVIAIVNDSVITLKDVHNLIARDLDFLQRLYGSQPNVLEQKIRELQAKYVEELVEEKLILHEFKTAGYQLPESYLEDRVDDEAKKFGDRVALTKTLQAQGLTEGSWRTKMREKEIVRIMWQKHVPQDPLISPFKIETHYEQNRSQYQVGDQIKLSMIVVTNRPNDSFFSAKRMAQEIRAKILDGAPFAEMARVYSQGSQSTEGGDWGWIERPVLRKDLAETAFSLKAGQLSDVIETPDGCYLMWIEEQRPTHVKTLADVREEIEATLKAKEYDRLRKKWIDRLKEKSFVRFFQ